MVCLGTRTRYDGLLKPSLSPRVNTKPTLQRKAAPSADPGSLRFVAVDPARPSVYRADQNVVPASVRGNGIDNRDVAACVHGAHRVLDDVKDPVLIGH